MPGDLQQPDCIQVLQPGYDIKALAAMCFVIIVLAEVILDTKMYAKTRDVIGLDITGNDGGDLSAEFIVVE